MGNIKWKPPFHEEIYDLSLLYKISQGRRETTIPDTPNDYANLYIGKYDIIILFDSIIKGLFNQIHVLIVRMLGW